MSVSVRLDIEGDMPPEARNIAEHLCKVIKDALEQAQADGRCVSVTVGAYEEVRDGATTHRDVFSDHTWTETHNGKERAFVVSAYYHVDWPAAEPSHTGA